MTQLPAEGRRGAPPPWPLPVDLVAQAKLERLHELIDELSIQAQGSGPEAQNAGCRMRALEERAATLVNQIALAREQEVVLWAELWATPQAVAWERLRWTRDVAQYVRWKIKAEMGDLDASKEARMLSDRIGLNPLALLRLRWEIAGDEVAEQRSERQTQRASAKSRARQGLKAVDGVG